MPAPDAWMLFEQWKTTPPTHESLAVVAMAHGWRPAPRELTDVERAEEMDRLYRTGRYLRPDKLGRMFGGLKTIKPGDWVPGIGPLPWAEMQVPKDKAP